GGQQLRTDKEGRLTIPLTIRNYETTDSWYPYSYDYRFSNNEAEAENFYQYGSVYAIHRDIMLQGQVEEKSGGTRVLVTTNKIDTSRIKTQEDLWQTELLKGEAVTKNVEASLYKIYYTKEEAGVSYDYINREMVTAYTYVRHEDLEQQYTITTQQGSYVLDGLPKSTDHDWYRLELSTTDSTGRMVRYQVYLSNPWEYGYRSNDGTHRYVLDKQVSPEEAQAATQVSAGDGYYYKPYSELSASFGDGENVTFVLMDNDEPMENFKGRLLYTVVQDNFHHTAITQKGEVVMPFGEDLVPNYIITGAYFDGKHIYALEDKYMRFSPQKRALEVSVTTDQDRYQPAENAKVTVTVTDKTTGKPQPGAEVVLSVVDEAIFALQEQNIDVLNSIYRSIYWPYPQKYTSFRQPGYNNAGEKGGGGGGDGQMRVDFKDTAWFQNGITAKDGTFTTVVQLPDNITSWRFTAIALTDDGKAGSTKEKAAATKDYFVTPIVSEQLLAGDTLAVGLRSSGVGVSANDQADYTVTVKNLETGKEESTTASGRLRTLETATFDGLSAGNYTVTVKGRCKGFADGVQLPVTIVESGIEVSRVATFNLKDGISVTPLRYPVTVALYDQSMVTYNKVFSNLLQKSSGIRIDARLVRVFIAKEYQNQGIDSYLSEVTQQDAKLLREGTLFGVLPYAQPDAELTVKMILAAPELVSKNGLYELGLQGAGAGESVAVRYLAEALNGEDNKAEIKVILDEGLASFTDEAYLAAALAVSEEPAAATAWYDRAVRPNLVELQGVSGEKVLAVKAQKDSSQDDCTAAASMVATLLQHSDASQLVSYLAQKDSIYEPYYLEQLLYLTRWQPAKAQGAKVSWQQDGKTVTKELGRSTEYLSLSRQQLAEANFKVQAGTVYADVYYAAPAQEVKDDENKLIGMTKTIAPVNGDSFQVGDLVKITITADLVLFDGDIGEGELVIEDYLPSGMRFEQYGATYQAAQYNPDSFWYLSNREQQRIRFGAWVTGKSLKLQPVVYYARCTTPGSYVVESTYMSSQTGPVWGSTQRDTIVIEP
ncbi:MAG: alpha-2-macroglobulin family protein, partial [Angelakisella sp.]|nr:alpha-2-macroglobulin family protein [Angelakisella sp.]